MAGRVASIGNPNFIQIHHGRLSINVPLGVFRGRSTMFREPDATEFWGTLVARYPWLTPGAIEEIKREAKDAMRSLIELEESSLAKARRLLEEGRPTQAMRLVTAYLGSNPHDADALQLKGRIHFALGESEEGYHSFAESRKAERPSRRRVARGR
ncbi:MAG: hypothetical protein LUO79_06195 [Methanomassiliicoccales archaeon]|nr:hypothetical protein [Methanomassiliicoccales archaeon]